LQARPSAGDWILLLLLVLLWGTAFAVIKVGVATIPPATFVAGRLVIATIVLGAGLALSGLRLPPWGGIWLRFAGLAVVGNALPFFLIGWGQERVDSSLAGILMAVMPLVTILLAHGFVPGERLTPRRAAGFLLGFGGVVVLIGPSALGRLGASPDLLVRQLAVLGGAVCYAINAILARSLPQTHAAVTATAVMGIAGASMLPVSLVADAPWTLAPAPRSVVAVLWMGLVPTAAAMVLFFRLVASAGPSFVSLMNYLIPLVALGVGVAAFGEEPGLTAPAGLALILAGIAVSQTERAGA